VDGRREDVRTLWNVTRGKWPYLLLFLVGILVLTVGLASRGSLTADQFQARDMTEESIGEAIGALQIALMGCGLALSLAAPVLYVLRARVSDVVDAMLRPQDDFYAHQGVAARGVDLFLISFLGLFCEMLVIRWLSEEFRLFAYFKNLPLLAAFMGLGIGFALVRGRESLFPAAIPLITFLCALTLFGSRTQIFDLIRYPTQDEFIWSLTVRSSIFTVAVFFGMIIVFFFLTMIIFLPFGQLTGRLMNQFRPLTGYTINILGSLLGIWGFSVMSFLSLPPFSWFLLALLLSLWFLRGRTTLMLGSAASAAVCLALLFVNRGESLWSPYYRIDVQPIVLGGEGAGHEAVPWGHKLVVNQDYHQKALDLSPEYVARYGHLSPDVEIAQRAYDLPYDFVSSGDVLVVGAGAGNDVASALRHGVEHVDAVEIDPEIARLGLNLHRERPYQSSRVTLVIDDARSYFEKSDKKYDLIVFGFLDSHTLFSSMSSVRLDNFVYTLQCLEEARDHLKERGVLVLTFSVAKKWIGDRLQNMLTTVFDSAPLALEVGYDGGIAFVVGPGLPDVELTEQHRLEQLAAEKRLGHQDPIPPATDDWPYLYLRERSVPDVYWQVLLILLVLSVPVVLRVFPESARVNSHFFFLGCAFFLLETKSITEMALLFGSTWIVNSVVISAILIMILGANLVVRRFKPSDLRPYYLLLLCSLVLNYAVPVSGILGQHFVMRGLVSGFFISLPLFFAGIIFATSLSRMKTVELAFGSNLLGSVVGGMLEYSSLIFGIKALYLIAALAYLLSWLGLRRKLE
jgi:SAM-dependent methyltransferase